MIFINQQTLRLNVPNSIASVLETLTVPSVICYSQCVVKAMTHMPCSGARDSLQKEIEESCMKFVRQGP